MTDIRLRPFKEQVAQHAKAYDRRGPSLWLGRTPASLGMLGFPELPLRMSIGVFHKIWTGKGGAREGVPLNQLGRLPELIDEPLALFDSATVSGAIVVLTTLRSPAGVVIASVEANCRDANAVVNMVTSVYAKEQDGWVAAQVAAGRLRYADIEKGPGILEASSHTLNRVTEPGSRNPSGPKVLLPEDLRKYREEQRSARLGPILKRG